VRKVSCVGFCAKRVILSKRNAFIAVFLLNKVLLEVFLMKKLVLVLLFCFIVSGLMFGCTTPVLDQPDSHGCHPAQGQPWCEAKQKCIVSANEQCTETTPMPPALPE